MKDTLKLKIFRTKGFNPFTEGFKEGKNLYRIRIPIENDHGVKIRKPLFVRATNSVRAIHIIETNYKEAA